MSVDSIFVVAAVVLAAVLLVRIFAGPRSRRAALLGVPMGHYMRALENGATPAQAMYAALHPLRYRAPWRGLSDDSLRQATEILASGLTIDPFRVLILQVENTRDARWIMDRAFLMGLVASDLAANGPPIEQVAGADLHSDDVRRQIDDDDDGNNANDFEDDDRNGVAAGEFDDKRAAAPLTGEADTSQVVTESTWRSMANAIVGSGTYALEGTELLQVSRLAEWLRLGHSWGYDWRTLYEQLLGQWGARRPFLPPIEEMVKRVAGS